MQSKGGCNKGCKETSTIKLQVMTISACQIRLCIAALVGHAAIRSVTGLTLCARFAVVCGQLASCAGCYTEKLSKPPLTLKGSMGTCCSGTRCRGIKKSIKGKVSYMPVIACSTAQSRRARYFHSRLRNLPSKHFSEGILLSVTEIASETSR